jgi:hypothetical protein
MEESNMPKGSKKHVLNLIDNKLFIDKMNDLLVDTNTFIENKDSIYPKGSNQPNEKTLSTFLKDVWNDKKLGADFIKWWIEFGSRTPQWDIISKCKIDGKEGILLVEAKAHKSEVTGDKGKKQIDENKKAENHKHIKAAIEQANNSINENNTGINAKLSIDTCYQLSNRVASAWWLASNDIPVVLIYLGFLKDDDFNDKFTSKEEWQNCIEKHIERVGIQAIINRKINTKAKAFYFISKSIDLKELK